MDYKTAIKIMQTTKYDTPENKAKKDKAIKWLGENPPYFTLGTMESDWRKVGDAFNNLIRIILKNKKRQVFFCIIVSTILSIICFYGIYIEFSR